MEEWKAVSGYEGRYEVSNLGRIRSLSQKGHGPRVLKALPGRDGYLWLYLCKDGQRKGLYVHRLVALAFGIIKPHEQADHANGNHLDNSPSNLRPATTSQNQANRRIIAKENTAYKGIDYQKRYGTWRARIMKDGHRLHLGTFNTDTEAAYAYDLAAKELFGEYARINFSGDS